MDVIKDKTEWLRKAQYRRMAIGRLRGVEECSSMSTLIGRWNNTEGKDRMLRLRYTIDREEGVVVVVTEKIRKEA